MSLRILFLALFLIGCDSKNVRNFKESENLECLQHKIQDQFIIHWKYQSKQVLKTTDINQFLKENESLVQFVEPNYNLAVGPDIQVTIEDSDDLIDNFRTQSGIYEQWAMGYLGQNQIVAVIDSGVNIDHPNLKNNIYKNSLEIPGNNIDDDQNGFIDDFTGWNFISQSPVIVDEIGHGTAMAGIISGNHLQGSQKSLGLAPSALILPIDILSSTTGSEFDAKKAIDYAVKMNVNIINNSWSIQCSEYLSSAVQMYENSNLIFVNSAGNQAQDVGSSSLMLASQVLKNFLNVGSLQMFDSPSKFSGYGPSINIWAPGENIPVLTSVSLNSESGLASGTSLSAAYISGAVAVVWSRYPEETAQQIVSRVVMTSKKSESVQIFQF